MARRVTPRCWLAEHGVYVPTAHRGPEPMPPCDGRLVKAHLISKQQLRRLWREVHHGRHDQRRALPVAKLEDLLADPRTWVPACGGPAGNGGHHGMLDHSRTLRVPFEALPAETIALAAELGMHGWLEREYLEAA
jgi:hypothetical protein